MAIPTIAPYPVPDEAALPPSRAGWELDAGRAALLVHDMQHYFLDAFDRDAPPVADVIPNIARLRDACDAARIPVVYTAQPGRQALEQRGLLSDLWGAGLGNGREERIVDELAPGADHRLLTKWRYSAFVRTDLLDVLRDLGRDQLIVCGVYAHLGCLMTACHAFMEDIQPFLVADAVADFSLDEHRLAVDYAARRCAVATTTRRALADLGLARVRAQVAEVLEVAPSALAVDEDLTLAGLDSIRMMSLVSQWQGVGIEISFEELIERPTLAGWTELLGAARSA